jgi:hypothetical protein
MAVPPPFFTEEDFAFLPKPKPPSPAAEDKSPHVYKKESERVDALESALAEDVVQGVVSSGFSVQWTTTTTKPARSYQQENVTDTAELYRRIQDIPRRVPGRLVATSARIAVASGRACRLVLDLDDIPATLGTHGDAKELPIGSEATATTLSRQSVQVARRVAEAVFDIVQPPDHLANPDSLVVLVTYSATASHIVAKKCHVAVLGWVDEALDDCVFDITEHHYHLVDVDRQHAAEGPAKTPAEAHRRAAEGHPSSGYASELTPMVLSSQDLQALQCVGMNELDGDAALATSQWISLRVSGTHKPQRGGQAVEGSGVHASVRRVSGGAVPSHDELVGVWMVRVFPRDNYECPWHPAGLAHTFRSGAVTDPVDQTWVIEHTCTVAGDVRGDHVVNTVLSREGLAPYAPASVPMQSLGDLTRRPSAWPGDVQPSKKALNISVPLTRECQQMLADVGAKVFTAAAHTVTSANSAGGEVIHKINPAHIEIRRILHGTVGRITASFWPNQHRVLLVVRFGGVSCQGLCFNRLGEGRHGDGTGSHGFVLGIHQDFIVALCGRGNDQTQNRVSGPCSKVCVGFPLREVQIRFPKHVRDIQQLWSDTVDLVHTRGEDWVFQRPTQQCLDWVRAQCAKTQTTIDVPSQPSAKPAETTGKRQRPRAAAAK